MRRETRTADNREPEISVHPVLEFPDDPSGDRSTLVSSAASPSRQFRDLPSLVVSRFLATTPEICMDGQLRLKDCRRPS